MMDIAHARSHRRGDGIDFRLVYLASLPAFLIATLVSRLRPGRRLASPRLSILGEARAAARTCGSFAHMG